MMRKTALFCLPLCALVVDSVNLRHSSRIDTRSRLVSDFPFYHTSDQIQKEARELVAGCSAKATLKTVTRGNVSIDYVRVSGPGPNSRPNRVAFLFGEHSRELISPESGLMLLKMLCGPSSKSDLVKKALAESDFQLILNANPISRARVEQGDYCLRDNPRGVDLNRNWDEKWELGDQATEGDQYHGEKPFSEVETQMVRDLVTEFKPTTFLSVHSGTLLGTFHWSQAPELYPARQEQERHLRIDRGSFPCYATQYGQLGFASQCTTECSMLWLPCQIRQPYS